MHRVIVPIRAAPKYLGYASVTSIYELIASDPEFAEIWFRVGGRTQAFEDRLIGYVEKRAETARAFPPAQPKRRRGRPPKARPAELHAE